MLSPLLVFAYAGEAAGQFDDYHALVTGLGKVNAAAALAQALAFKTPGCVINLGTAGSQKFAPGSVVNCTRFIQRDMNVTPLGFAPYQTPFGSEPPILDAGVRIDFLPEAICGTGDQFVTGARGDEPWDVIDMEAYALALVSARQRVPFICLKYISDGADGQAHREWDQALADAARALRAVLDRLSGGQSA